MTFWPAARCDDLDVSRKHFHNSVVVERNDRVSGLELASPCSRGCVAAGNRLRTRSNEDLESIESSSGPPSGREKPAPRTQTIPAITGIILGRRASKQDSRRAAFSVDSRSNPSVEVRVPPSTLQFV
jgi:hypothetical protein